MIALIPARGGSKGLPGKNIIPFGGKPLIAHTIEAALSAKTVDRVIVSTDDQEIADVAKKYGAEVPFLRPRELAGDQSRAIDVYRHTIEQLCRNDGADPIDEFVVLLPTAPFRNALHIDEAVELFYEKKAESVISVTLFEPPVRWALKGMPNGMIKPLFSDLLMKNRQEEEHSFCPNGAIYIFSVPYIMTHDSYYGERTYPYVMPLELSLDIDTELDLQRGEFLLARSISDGGVG